jgi:excisionase family DNA binding protein
VLVQDICQPLESLAVSAYDDDMDEIHVDLDKPWLSVADICEYMDVSTFVVTSVLRSGELPAVKFGREWRIATKDFEVWINQQRGVSDREASRDEVAPPVGQGL